jgi:hypothetical protein
MGQKQKLFEDTAGAMLWMNEQSFREFVISMVADHPQLVRRLQREIARAEKKLLTAR